MTLDECESIFAEVRSSSSFDETKAALRKVMAPDFYPIMSLDTEGRNTLWRGRRCNEGLRFANVADMGCPPEDSTGVGRLNEQGAPCLYATTKLETVFAELDLQAGEFVQVIGIRTRLGTQTRVIAIGELFHVYRSGSTKMFGSTPGAPLAKFINSMSFEARDRMLYIDASLAEILADANARFKQYLTSRAVAAVAYETIAPAEGFYYPSVRVGVGTNLTMKAATYYEKCRVVCAQLIRILTPRRFGFYDHQIVSEASRIGKNGEFVWQRPPSETKATFSNLTKSEAESLDISNSSE